MQKKALLIVIILLLIVGGVLLLNRKPKEENKEMTNSTYGEYNGIYQYKKYQFRVFHKDDMIYFKVYRNKDIMGNNFTSIEGNKVEIDEYVFEFKNNSLKVKSSNKEIPSGDYEKTSGYSTDEIYNDYIGDVSFFNNSLNGRFKNDDYTIETVQKNEEELLMNNINEEDATTITMQKVKENHYESELFDTKYELEFKDDTIEVKELENNKEQKLTGEYKRVESLTKEEVINLFMQ